MYNLRFSHDRFALSAFSSGEYALFAIFSRLAWAVSRLRKQKKSKNSLIIILDEAEIGLHPKWQLEFIKTALEFINKECAPAFPVQFILTSHSPFIASDLPANSLIFLKKEDGRSKAVQLDENKDTFGANVHVLYQDTFFVEDSLIGRFALDKINELIDKINHIDKKVELSEIKELRQRIEIIGEPFIRKKLAEQLDRLVGGKDINDQIAQLEAQVEQLKKEQQDDK